MVASPRESRNPKGKSRSRRAPLLTLLVAAVLVASVVPTAVDAEPARVRLAVFGDDGVTTNTRANVDGSLADGAQGYVGLGDYYYYGAPSAWVEMFRPLLAKGAHLAIGNHDDVNALRAYFPEGTQWSKTVNGARFVALNGMRDFDPGSVDHETIRGYLCGATEEVKVLLTHHNWWLGAEARHPGGEFRASAATMDEMVKACGVDLVLAGHEHNYQRMVRNGIPYVIVGTGGQSIYPVAGSPGGTVASHAGYGRLLLDVGASGFSAHFKTLDGRTLDSFSSGGAGGQEPASATFTPYDGNAWWVQTKVSAGERVSGVCAVVNDGACVPLSYRWWGAWATSTHAPEGSRVVFRATLASGAVATSVAYVWPVD